MINRRSPEQKGVTPASVGSTDTVKHQGDAETSREEREEIERALDLLAETMFLKASKVNEGNNGVILFLNVELLDAGMKKFCEEHDIDLGKEKAVKVMKLYRSGAGKEEFRLHKKAFQVVGNDPDSVALIPRPVFYRDFELSEAARERVSEVTGKASAERAEIIVMDFVQGEDLAEVLLKEALLRRRPDIHADEIQGWTVEQLQQEVGPMIGYKMPGGKGKTVEEREVERERIEEENAARLYDYLSKQGFVLDPSILTRLNRTLTRLHEAGIVHRDAHERNIMISGDYNHNPASDERHNTVYLIDFGGAMEFTGSYRSQVVELYRDHERRYYQDEKVVRKLEVLARPSESSRERHVREDGEALMTLLSSKRRNKGFAEKRNVWLERHDAKHGEGAAIEGGRVTAVLYDHFFKQEEDVMKDFALATFADYLVTFIEQGRASSAEITSALEQKIDQVSALHVRTKLSELRRAIEFIGRTYDQHQDE